MTASQRRSAALEIRDIVLGLVALVTGLIGLIHRRTVNDVADHERRIQRLEQHQASTETLLKTVNKTTAATADEVKSIGKVVTRLLAKLE